MKNLFKVFLTVGALIFVLSCGGSSGDGVVTICDDAAGSWSISESFISYDGCGSGSYSYTITVNQTVCVISVSSSSLPGVTFSGTVNGSNISWTGSYPEDDGTTTITSMSATLSGNYLSGTSSWRWADSYDSCIGASTFTGTR